MNDFMKPEGILQDIMDYIDSNSAVSIPFFNLGAAITFLGSVLGQRVQTETGLRTNIYSISLGYSGTGKNAPFGTIPKLLTDTDAKTILGPTELTSSASILKWISTDNQQVSLLMIDEIGLLLNGIKNPNSFASDLPRILIKLFSSTDRGEIKGYATGDSVIIPWHHLSFYGASTPERFWESLTMGDVTDGFLARILLWENHDDAPLPKDSICFKDSKLLTCELNKIITNYPIIKVKYIPQPRIIPKSKNATKLLKKFSIRYHGLKNKNKTNQYGLPSIYGRAAEHVSKISLIHAVSNDFNTSVVTSKSIIWATQLIDYIISNTTKQIKENISENEIDRLKQKMIRWIKSQDKGSTMREIQRSPGRGLLSKELKNIINSLLLSGEIVEKKEGRVDKFFIQNES